MKRVISSMLLVCCSCATTQATTKGMERPYLIDSDRWVEEHELPEEPDSTEERGSFAIGEGDVSPHDAICLTESLAVEYREFRIGYDYLQNLYRADQVVWTAHREVYETKIQMLEDEVKDSEPSWWEKNDGPVMGAAGFILGTVTTIAVAFAVEGSTK
jgi:hypothetical protein